MSEILVEDAGGVGVETSTHGSPLSVADRDMLIRRAKNIIAGIERPPALDTTAQVSAFLEYHKRTGVLTEESEIREVRDDLNLQAHYSGRQVACVKTADGILAVIACDGEIDLLFKELTQAELRKVTIMFPD